jgi:hypothetical protein
MLLAAGGLEGRLPLTAVGTTGMGGLTTLRFAAAGRLPLPFPVAFAFSWGVTSTASDALMDAGHTTGSKLAQLEVGDAATAGPPAEMAQCII